MATAGVSLVAMQVSRCWQSPGMPSHVAQVQLAKQGAVARLRYGKEWSSPDPPAP